MFRERKNERMGNHPARLAITFRAGGAFLGSIGVYPVDMTRVGLTYWIDADCHGRGLGTEALKAFSPVALTAYGVRAIQENVAVENLPSIRALERASYVRLGASSDGPASGADRRVLFYYEDRKNGPGP